ncbi:MAG: hypothetical protein M3Y27_28115 [Acidobacteriota bacterium]|nr:hypothetical protein [Acidobacteriota bacterium]
MRFLMILALATQSGHPAQPPASDYASLWRYQGTWQVTPKSHPAGAKPDVLINQCSILGQFFACGQNVNGQPDGLVVFIPNGKPGHFYTQTIMPEGRATGRDDLEISGNSWTYSSRRDEGGKTTFYRTTNKFADKNHIHFEQAESTDGTQWSVKNSGDEVRVGAASVNAR